MRKQNPHRTDPFLTVGQIGEIDTFDATNCVNASKLSKNQYKFVIGYVTPFYMAYCVS